MSRILRLTVFSLLLLSVLWGGLWWHLGRPTLAVLGALLIPFIYFPALVLESLLIAVLNRSDPSVPRASLRQRLQSLFAEAWLMLAVFYWRQAFRHGAVTNSPRPPRGRPRRGVVLVHGFRCNRAFWNPWMRRLQALGVPFVAVDLDPPFDDIDRYAAPIEQAVQELERQTGLPPVLVGHSMGGLALRAWLRTQRSEARVHRLITIGTPHRGTWLTRLSPKKGQQMSLDSQWLQGLQRQEPPQRYAAFTCFWSHCDNVVFPATTARLPGADNRHVPGAAHVQMSCRAEVFDEVLRWLEPDAKARERARA